MSGKIPYKEQYQKGKRRNKDLTQFTDDDEEKEEDEGRD